MEHQQYSSKAADFFQDDLPKFRESQELIRKFIFQLSGVENARITSNDVIESLNLFKKDHRMARSLYQNFINNIFTRLVSRGILIDTRLKANKSLIYVPDSNRLLDLSDPIEEDANNQEIYNSNFKKFKRQFYTFIDKAEPNQQITAKDIFESLDLPNKENPYLRKKYTNYINVRLLALVRKGILFKFKDTLPNGSYVYYLKLGE